MNFHYRFLLNGIFQMGIVALLGCQEYNDGMYKKTAVKLNNVMATEEDGYAVITYSLDYVSDQETSFIWSTQDDTAVEGVDYMHVPEKDRLVTIPPGEKTGVIRIPLANDRLSEEDKTFKVMITPISLDGIEGTGSQLEATVVIVDNDEPPTIRINNITVDEGEGKAIITYTLGVPSGQKTSFRWFTVEGSAQKGEDYIVPLSTVEVVIPERTTTGHFSIMIKDDHWDEDNEHFGVAIDPVSLVGFKKSGNILEAEVSIEDNDEPPIIHIGDVLFDEANGQAEITYSLNSVSGKETSFRWSTQDGSAQSSEDYTAISDQLVNIPAGSESGVLRVALTDDSFYEGNEKFKVMITPASLVDITESKSKLEAEVIIKDNEQMPVISLADVEVSEGGTAIVTYQLSPVSNRAGHFSWSTQNGRAHAGRDYTTVANQRVTIPARTSTGSFSIVIADNNVDEENRDFRVVIDPASLISIAERGSDLASTVTIIDNDGPPTIRITDATVDEGDGHAEVSYHLSSISGKEAHFSWSTEDGSAQSGEDYTAVINQKVVVPPKTLQGVFRVAITDDIWDEDSEYFKVKINATLLSNIQSAGPLEKEVTIVDNDASPTVRITNIKIGEGDGHAKVSYHLSSISGKEVSFHWSTQDGSAQSSEDYAVIVNQLVSIPAGSESGTLQIALVDDSFYESEEKFKVVIAPVSLVNIAESGSKLEAEVAIEDNEQMPVISIADVEVSEGRSATVTYRLSPMNDQESSFSWSTQDGIARAGDDYTAVADQRVTIPARTETGSFSIVIADNSIDEENRDFRVMIDAVSLVDITERGSDLDSTVTIIDNDGPPTIRITDMTVGEGDGHVEVGYHLSSVSGKETSFVWSTEDGSARAGNDYTAVVNQRVTIPARTATGSFSIVIANNNIDEENKDFRVVMTPSSLVGLTERGSDLTSIVEIIDNDGPPTIRMGDVVFNEANGHAEISYSLGSISGKETGFTWSTRGGSAQGGKDYTTITSQLVSIPAGSESGTLQVELTDDPFYEGEEKFSVVIASVSLANITASGSKLEAEVTIEDNEQMPMISIADVDVGEGGSATVTYRLSPMSDQESSFRWSTQDGSAQGGDDYTAVANQRVIIPAQIGTGSFSIEVAENDIDEENKDFRAVIASASLVGIAERGSDLASTVTIVDNDGPPAIRITDMTVGEGDGHVEVSYRLSSVSGKETSFIWSTEDGSARAGGHYTAVANQRVTIPARTQAGAFFVVIAENSIDEENKDFRVAIASTSLRGIEKEGSNLTSIITIIDNDDPPAIHITDMTVGEGGGHVKVGYSLSSISGKEINFTWFTEDGSAQSGEDYTAITNQAVTVSPGIESGTLRVILTDDSFYEGDEKFKVVIAPASLANIMGSKSKLEAEVTIAENEPVPTISIADINVNEGGIATITYHLSPVSAQESSFRWFTQDGSALAGDDYTAVANQKITIPAKTGTGSLFIMVAENDIDEENKDFRAVIAPSHLEGIAERGSNLTSIVTIIDNDAPPTIRIADVVVVEENGHAEVTYYLSSISAREAHFHWSTQDDSAKSGEDYTAVINQKVIIPPKTSEGVFQVAITNDLWDEDSEYFKVKIAAASLNNLRSGVQLEAEVTIFDNDHPPTISIADVMAGKEEGHVEVTYRLNPVSGREASFSWSTQDGSAKGGEDYTAVINQKVVIPAGRESGTLRIALISDDEDEGDEDFKVVIDSSSLANIRSEESDQEATVTLRDIISESYTQPETSNKIDILWVVDNSPSMGDEQAGLASNFETFITNFVDVEEIDFKMGIITTDSAINRVVGDDLTLQAATEDKKVFVTTFQEKIQVGITGHTNERGFLFSKKFLQYDTTSWVREGAYLVIIYVSDENDHSTSSGGDSSTAYWVGKLQSYKTHKRLLKIYSIIHTDPSIDVLSGIEYYGGRYKEASHLAGGLIADITGDFSNVLADFGENITRLANSFALSEKPQAGSVEVRVNGILINSRDWSYDEDSRTVRFEDRAVPDSGATIKISYLVYRPTIIL